MAFHSLREVGVDDWLVRKVTLFGVPFQNWMVVTFALVLIAALINLGERR